MYMSAEQQDQQVTFKYLFTITPLEIKSNSKLKSTTAKAILIKLGNKTAKSTQMNTPLDLQIDVLYSRTLQKYCPIKGIIKIYDVSEDGTEIISCVGGFQTEELLNEGKSNVVIEKELGTSKLKMEINIVNKSQKRLEEQKGIIPRQNSTKDISSSREKYLLAKKSPSERSNIPPTAPPSLRNSAIAPQNSSDPRRNPQMASEYVVKGVEIPYKNTSTNINKSLQKINQALNFKQRFEENPISTKANEMLGRAELQTLKQQLSDEKRRTAITEDRLAKANAKLTTFKTAVGAMQTDLKAYIEIFTRITNELDIKDGKPQVQLMESAKFVSLKYKDKQVEKTFREFIEFAAKKVREFVPLQDLEIDSAERGAAETEQLRKQVGILKKLTMEKDKKIYSLEKGQEGMEQTIQHLKETNKHLSEENSYLREKNDQIELTLYHKENDLENRRKQVDQNLLDISELENRLYNCGLQNEELREEVDNCNQTIQQYRQKYGDLKNVKNRAIQMEIKECIRWIDQQNRDLELSQMEETMQSQGREGREQVQGREDSLSSVIRNLEIEKVPIEQMSIIRDELMRILKKIDNLMTK